MARNPQVQASIATPEEIRQLVEQDFADYYSSARRCLRRPGVDEQCVGGALCDRRCLFVLPASCCCQNAANVAWRRADGANDRATLFFGLILPTGCSS